MPPVQNVRGNFFLLFFLFSCRTDLIGHLYPAHYILERFIALTIWIPRYMFKIDLTKTSKKQKIKLKKRKIKRAFYSLELEYRYIFGIVWKMLQNGPKMNIYSDIFLTPTSIYFKFHNISPKMYLLFQFKRINFLITFLDYLGNLQQNFSYNFLI